MSLNHEIAVDIAAFHGRAYVRTGNPRHLDTIENLNQIVSSPALWLTDTVTRLGRNNALACGFDRRLVDNCIRLRRERASA